MQSHPDFTGNIVRQNEQRRSPRYCLEHRSVASCFPHTRLAYPVQSHKVSIKEEYHPLITSRRRHTVIESPTMSHFQPSLAKMCQRLRIHTIRSRNPKGVMAET